MASFNNVTLIGNLTRDPETRTVGDSSATGFGLAINHKWKSKTGEDREDVMFIDCTAWGKAGEVIAQYSGKGKSIFVSGRLRQENWEDKNGGGKRSKISVIVETFQFLGGGERNDGGGSRQQSAPPARQQHRDLESSLPRCKTDPT